MAFDLICTEWLNLSEDVEHDLGVDIQALVHRHGAEAVVAYVREHLATAQLDPGPETADGASHAGERPGLETQAIGRTGQTPEGGSGPAPDAESEPRKPRIRIRPGAVSETAGAVAGSANGHAAPEGGERGGQDLNGDAAAGSDARTHGG